MWSEPSPDASNIQCIISSLNWKRNQTCCRLFSHSLLSLSFFFSFSYFLRCFDVPGALSSSKTLCAGELWPFPVSLSLSLSSVSEHLIFFQASRYPGHRLLTRDNYYLQFSPSLPLKQRQVMFSLSLFSLFLSFSLGLPSYATLDPIPSLSILHCLPPSPSSCFYNVVISICFVRSWWRWWGGGRLRGWDREHKFYQLLSLIHPFHNLMLCAVCIQQLYRCERKAP